MAKKIISLIIVICCIMTMSAAGFAQSTQISKGDTVVFGTYNQDLNPNNGKEDLEWIVLDIDDGEALLITKLCMDNKPYNDKKENVTWETCSLRKWLNEEFYKEAFSTSERKEILYTDLTTPNNSALNTDGGNNTRDKVFILSESEAEKYFEKDSDRMADHISVSNVKTSDAMNWWLRTPGINQKSAVIVVGSDGSLLSFGDTVTNHSLTAVRPCIRVEVSALTGEKGNKDDEDVSELTAEPGDRFYLGSYEQDGNSANGLEPIVWRILCIDGDAALAVSEYCLDSKPYNEKLKDITWENCTLRKWLNHDFYDIAFSSEEKKCILTATCNNKLSDYYDTDGGNETNDDVFLLSADDALMFLGNNNPNYKDDGLRAVATPYAINNGATDIDGYCFWWLRSTSVLDQNKASVINVDGSVVNGGDGVNSTLNAVRPSIWVDLNYFVFNEETDKTGLKKCEDWENITQIAGTDSFLVGLKKDGTVAICGEVPEGIDVSGWKDIKQIVCEWQIPFVAGLQKDGTVVISCSKESDLFDFPVEEVQKWKNISRLSAGFGTLCGFHEEGVSYFEEVGLYDFNTVQYFHYYSIRDVRYGGTWLLIIDKDSNGVFAADGTVCETYKDVVSATGKMCMYVLHSDGTVQSREEDEYFNKELKSWKNVKQISSESLTSSSLAAIDNKGNLLLNDSAKELYGDISLSGAKYVYAGDFLAVLMKDNTVQIYEQ